VSLTRCSMNRQHFLFSTACPGYRTLGHANLQCWISLLVYYDCALASDRNSSFPKSMGQNHLSALNPSNREFSQFRVEDDLSPLHHFTQLQGLALASTKMLADNNQPSLTSFLSPRFKHAHMYMFLKCWWCYQGNFSCCIYLYSTLDYSESSQHTKVVTVILFLYSGFLPALWSTEKKKYYSNQENNS